MDDQSIEPTTLPERRPAWLNSRWAILLAAGLLVLAGLVIYSNSFSGEFIWDDIDSIPNNPTLHEWSSLARFLTPLGRGETVTGRPLLNISFALNYAVGGLNVWGYHAVNLALHILNALLLFEVVRRTLQLPPLKARYEGAALGLAWAIALLWLVHPLLGEAVAYIVQRAESLAALFFLLVLYSVVRARQSRRPVWWYLSAVGSCWLGVATKETVTIAPLVVLLYDRTFWGRSFRKALRQRWGLYLGLVASWSLFAGMGTYSLYAKRIDTPDAWRYACTQPGVILFYLRMVFWPVGQSHEYSFPAAKTVGAVLPWACVLGLLLAVTMWGVVKRRGWGFLGASFFLILTPSSSIMPLDQFACDRRMYLSLAAVLTLVVCGGYALGQRWAGRFWQRGKVAVGISLVTLTAVVLGILTFRHNEIYRDEVSLWRSLVACGRNPAWACNGLGIALAKQGHSGEALDCYEDALRADPDFPMAHNNLGIALFSTGHLEEAVKHFQEALRLQPDLAEVHYNLGNALSTLNRLEEAIAHYEAALRINPNSAAVHYNLASKLADQGRLPEAIEHYETALRIKPDFSNAHNNLGGVLMRAGRTQEALAHYEAVSQANPNHAAAHSNWGVALAALNRLPEAIEHYQQALQIQPDCADVHCNYGDALANSGRAEEAIEHYRIAARLNPNLPQAHLKLSLLAAQTGKVREAIDHGREIVRLMPDQSQSHLFVAWLIASHDISVEEDVKHAVAIAEQACNLTGRRDVACLDALAAAYAAARRFDEAVATAKEAWQMAQASGQDSLAEEIHIRLQLYRDRKPYREPTTKTHTQEK